MSSTPPTSSRSTQRQIDDLPVETLRDILSKLPLRTLITSRYVCTSWNQIYHDLIRDPVLRHLRANKGDPDSNFLLVCQKEEKLCNLYLVDDDDKRVGNSMKLLNTAFHQPSREKVSYRGWEKIKIIGSANGLICLSLRPKYDSFILCNPITREIFELPNPKEDDGYGLNQLEHSDFTGFAFDEATEEYIVVYTRFYNANADCTALFVHTLGSGVWRRNDIDNLTGVYFCNREAVFLKGAFHLTTKGTYRNKRPSIGVIDIGAVTIVSFELPSPNSKGTLRLMKGCLGWIEIDEDGGCGNVWIMKDYGVAESWSKDYVIAKEDFMPFNMVSFSDLKNNGLFIRKHEYYYVDKEEPSHVHQSEDLFIKGQQVDVLVHAGSLVSPIRVFSAREMARMTLYEKDLKEKRIDSDAASTNEDELSFNGKELKEMVDSAIGMDPYNDDLNANEEEEEDIDLWSLFS